VTRGRIATKGPSREGGFAMPALLAMLAIMALALLIAMPAWRYLVKDDKEQELIFRGRQISSAIARFQRKNGNAFPASLDQLVQGKYLRKAYADPMTADGKWRIIRPGEGGLARPGASPAPPGPGGARPSPTPQPTPTPTFGGGTGSPAGPVGGVASLSMETGLRTVNGSESYNRWVFSPTIPLIVGGRPSGGPGPPGQAPAAGRLRVPDAETFGLSR
jgi:type II secretory pathway pseudopilin PulG